METDSVSENTNRTTDSLLVQQQRRRHRLWPWRGRTGRPVRIGELSYGQPECRLVVGRANSVSVRVRFGHGALTHPWICTALFFRMAFDDTRIEVVDAEIDAAHGPLSVSGLRSNAVGWYLSPLGGNVARQVTAHATLIIPADLVELTGTVRAEMPVHRAGVLRGRTGHARTPGLHEFAVSVPGRTPVISASIDTSDVSADDQPALQAPQGAEPRGSVRLSFAADIERYSRFRNPEAVRAQQRLAAALARARRQAGIGEDQVDTQESGDGQFVVLPTGLDESEVIPALVHGFRIALAEANADLNEHARLRLRIALHRGHIERGVNGWAGASAVAVHRILDSAPAREALSDHPACDFVLIVADSLFQDVIAHGYGLLRPETFTSVDVEVPAKNFADRAWIYLPEP